jgi:hypothetical protein
MFRFTIRDVLWLMVVVGVGLVWLMDRDRIRRDRIELAKREAEHVSRAKMWEAEAQRAEKRASASREALSAIYVALKIRGLNPRDVIDSNNNPIPPWRRQKPDFIDDATR